MSTIWPSMVASSFSRVGKTTCTGSAPIARSSTARVPTPGLTFCSAAITYIQNHTGSLSEAIKRQPAEPLVLARSQGPLRK